MSLGEDFRTLMLSLASSADERIHQNHMPERSTYPAIFYIRNSRNRELTLDKQAGLTQTVWNVECLSTNMDEAIELSDVIADLNGYIGSQNETTFKAVFVDDVDDDYTYQNDASDEGISMVALTVTTWTS